MVVWFARPLLAILGDRLNCVLTVVTAAAYIGGNPGVYSACFPFYRMSIYGELGVSPRFSLNSFLRAAGVDKFTQLTRDHSLEQGYDWSAFLDRGREGKK